MSPQRSRPILKASSSRELSPTTSARSECLEKTAYVSSLLPSVGSASAPIRCGLVPSHGRVRRLREELISAGVNKYKDCQSSRPRAPLNRGCKTTYTILGTEDGCLAVLPQAVWGSGRFLGLEKWSQVELLDFEALLAFQVHMLGNVHKPRSNTATIYLHLPAFYHMPFSRLTLLPFPEAPGFPHSRPPLCSCCHVPLPRASRLQLSLQNHFSILSLRTLSGAPGQSGPPSAPAQWGFRYHSPLPVRVVLQLLLCQPHVKLPHWVTRNGGAGWHWI